MHLIFKSNDYTGKQVVEMIFILKVLVYFIIN